jgi:hypothetical protein
LSHRRNPLVFEADSIPVPGNLTQAYVIAHVIGHHAQTLLGILEKIHSARLRASQAEGNQLSVMKELQADCFAGIWAHHADRARQILEQGGTEEALNAASAIGDDCLQPKKEAMLHRILLLTAVPNNARTGSNGALIAVMFGIVKPFERINCKYRTPRVTLHVLNSKTGYHMKKQKVHEAGDAHQAGDQ